MRRIGRWGAAVTAGAMLAGCGAEESGPPASQTPGQAGSGTASSTTTRPSSGEDSGGSDLARRGERIYNVNCIACHHRDPTKDGGLGPAIAGASQELLEARVLRGEYPPGYTPKRDTRLMVPLTHLAPEMVALTAFLAQSDSK